MLASDEDRLAKERTEKERAAYDQYWAAQTQEQEARAMGMIGQLHRPSLRDRLKRTIEAAEQEQSRARKANELYDLLAKNPEVARILELLEDLGER